MATGTITAPDTALNLPMRLIPESTLHISKCRGPQTGVTHPWRRAWRRRRRQTFARAHTAHMARGRPTPSILAWTLIWTQVSQAGRRAGAMHRTRGPRRQSAPARRRRRLDRTAQIGRIGWIPRLTASRGMITMESDMLRLGGKLADLTRTILLHDCFSILQKVFVGSKAAWVALVDLMSCFYFV